MADADVSTEEGYVDFASWLVVLQEEVYDMLLAVASMPEPEEGSEDFFRIIDASVTYHHETIHFWHSISTRFLYNFSCDFMNLCIDAVNTIGREQIRSDDYRIVEIQKKFTDLLDRLAPPSVSESTIRTLDVIEGCAVLCSYRITTPRGSHETFRKNCLDYFYTDDSSRRKYRSAYLFAEEKVGELAYDLFAPACYLALQYKNPGDTLVALLEHAKEGVQVVPRELIVRDPLTFLLTGTDMQESDCLPLIIRRGIPQGRFSHPVLAPYIKTIAISTLRRIADVFARPYIYFWDYVSNENALERGELVSQLLPPLVFHADYSTSRRKYTATKLGRHFGEDYLSSIFILTTLPGLVDRLVFGDRLVLSRHPKVLCPHQKCPVYKTNLCRTHYNFPLEDFKKCVFPEVLKEFNLEDLIEQEEL